jgi:hypothetical protein
LSGSKTRTHACPGRRPGPTQAKPTQAKPTQAGPTQAKPTQAGPTQAKPTQAGPTQAGPTQAGPTQAGPTQAGPTQAKQGRARHTYPRARVRCGAVGGDSSKSAGCEVRTAEGGCPYAAFSCRILVFCVFSAFLLPIPWERNPRRGGE